MATGLILPGVLRSFPGWTKPTLRRLWRTLDRTQREDDRGLKEEIGEDELVLHGLEGRLQNIHLHTSSTGTTNRNQMPVAQLPPSSCLSSGNGLL